MSLGRSAGLSDPGRKRVRNEDAFVVDPPLFAVADGMGGAQAGELASGLAAAALRESVPGAATEERIVELIREANRRVYARARQDAAASGMGTTVTVALVEGDRVVVGHVGDSRAYLLRDGQLHQVTDDHSLVAELVRSGRITPQEAESHPQRSVITRALGTDPDVEIDTFSIDASPGDLFLLCSDGLTSMVDEGTIRELAQRHRHDLELAARELLAAANRGGGEDNITAILFEITADEPTQPMPVVPAPAPAEAATEADDEDTLSELDRVPAVDTGVISVEGIRALLEREAEARRATVADEETAAEAEEPQESGEPAHEPRASVLQRLVALIVIAGLSALIVVLVLWGLAR